jgi:hypothetical protein
MAFLHSAVAAHDFTHDRTHVSRERKHGFFSRFMQALVASRMQQAEREIACYFAGTGGKFTDEAEREIERRLMDRSRW